MIKLKKGYYIFKKFRLPTVRRLNMQTSICALLKPFINSLNLSFQRYIWTILATLLAQFEQVSLAQQTGELGLAAKATATAESFSKSNTLLLTLIILTIVAAAIFLSSSALRKRKGSVASGVGPQISNLYLEVQYKLISASIFETKGRLRHLSCEYLELVAPSCTLKHCKLEIDLASLDKFPLSSAAVTGEVLSCKPLGGKRESYMMKVALDPIEGPIERAILAYMDSLCETSNVDEAG